MRIVIGLDGTVVLELHDGRPVGIEVIGGGSASPDFILQAEARE